MKTELLIIIFFTSIFTVQAQTSVMDYYRARIKAHREEMKKKRSGFDRHTGCYQNARC